MYRLQPQSLSSVATVSALTLIAVASVGSLPQQAAAQGTKSLQAYLGFLEAKPKALPPPRPTLPVTHTQGTESYSIRAPRSATGITLTVVGDASSKAKASQYSAPTGKKLKRKAWSSKQRSNRLHILSFDRLGFGVNRIRIAVDVPKRPEQAQTYDVMVTRAETLGSDPTLTALALSETGLVPAFASETKSYAAEVPYPVTSLAVTAHRMEVGTTVQLSGTASDGTELAVDELTASGMTVGRNVITVLATAEDGSTTDRYTVEVVRQRPSNDAKLLDVSLAEGAAGIFGLDIPTGGGILRPAFSPEITSYEVNVPAEVVAVKMAIARQSIAALGQSGKAADGTELALRTTDMTIASMTIGDITVRDIRRRIVTFTGLQAGKNTIEIYVTAEDGVTRGAYRVTVTRESAP